MSPLSKTRPAPYRPSHATTTTLIPTPSASPTVPAPSPSQKGAIFEWGVSNLALFLSGGELHTARPLPDDQDVDRTLTRLAGRRAAFLQLKSRATMRRRNTLELAFAPIANAKGRDDLYLLAGELVPRSPWVGPRFALIPASKLPPPSPRGDVKLFIPLSPTSRSRWRSYVHDTLDMATILSTALDSGPAYPFPPPGGPDALVKRLTNRAQGHLIESEIAARQTG